MRDTLVRNLACVMSASALDLDAIVPPPCMRQTSWPNIGQPVHGLRPCILACALQRGCGWPAWHGDGREVARHTIEGNIQVRLAVLLALIFSLLWSPADTVGTESNRASQVPIGKGMATAGLVLGILTVIFKLIPGVNVL
jgi:hypothetical protein